MNELSPTTLFQFDITSDLSAIGTQDAQIETVSRANADALRVTTGHSANWPGITLKAPEGMWDFGKFQMLEMDITNAASEPVTVHWRIDSPRTDGKERQITQHIMLKPHEQKTFAAPIPRSLPGWLGSRMLGMRGFPGGLAKEAAIDPSRVVQFIIFVSKPTEDHVFEIREIRAVGEYEPPQWLNMDESTFFPFIDEYGQFVHCDWPGKVHSSQDLAQHKADEAAELDECPLAEDWDQYGGWQSGPQLAATGHFRVEKHEGMWWLVDPDGRLFWSHGIDCVGAANGVTPITDREYWYQGLPDEDSTLAQFYGTGSWAPHNYYEGKHYRTYNFTAVNLLRKYGEDWAQCFANLTHRRLRSWGMNTIANWSDASIYLMRQTPYVVSVNFGGKLLEGSEGYWGRFRDVFDPSFETEVRESMSWQKERTADDPWCLGYFVDNEIAWGDEVSLAIAALVSPADQPAKHVFVEDLRTKYTVIEALNRAWGTHYASWDALIDSQQPPDRERAYADLTAFYTKTAETYFRICRDAVKEVAPNTLYLGCRFAWANDFAVRAAAKYCDVISYNFYRRDIENVRLPDGIDKPIIVGEFHFGALDRGMFHTGLVPVRNQEERAKAYHSYVTGALHNPLIVGTHWFQYGDQATTGRGDGENYQIGFLSITDRPYSETIQAARDVGYHLYATRRATTHE